MRAALGRVGLWFGSLVFSVLVFSFLFDLMVNRGPSGGAIFVIFRATMIFAFPVSCLCLPLVIIFGEEAWRKRIILLSVILIGPASLALLGVVQQARGGDPERIWRVDPLLGFGLDASMVFALIVGFLTAFVYRAALRIAASKS